MILNDFLVSVLLVNGEVFIDDNTYVFVLVIIDLREEL